MNLQVLSPEQLQKIYETDLREAFPPSELKPLSAMERMRAKGIYDPLGLFDENQRLLGCALLWKHPEGRYLLLDYLCVPRQQRGRACGGLLGESEAPTGDPERDGLILRRLDFYRRSGAAILGYDTALFGVHFKTICWATPLPCEDEILKNHQEIYFSQLCSPRFFCGLNSAARPCRARGPG